tara:strand:+ start:2853 stop:3401 length:549 start_codon:yes stop_codon:yes gene_type:complete
VSLPNALSLCEDFNKVVYRYHNPRWSYAPTSGQGAAQRGGRFNRPKTEALYTSLDITTSFYEAAQGMISKPAPLTLCSYKTDLTQILDLTSNANKQALGISDDQLGCAWRLEKIKGNDPVSWLIADDLMGQGVAGILVKSHAPNLVKDGVNLVLWDWSETRPNKVTVFDPFGNLPKNQDSWK